MKKIFLSMLAVSAILAGTACSEDDLVSGEKASGVSFELKLEGSAQTKAISDGLGADKLVYAVYDEQGAPVNVFNGTNQKTETNVSFADPGHSVQIDLAKGQTYQVVFWAQDADCKAYNTDDLQNVTIDYKGVNNDETRDAFFKAEKVTVTGNQKVSVVLRRPFAQLNVGVTEEDWNKAKAAGIEIETSSVTIPEAASKINLLTGAVSESTAVTYTLNTIPNQNLKVGNTEYEYLSMCYVLPNATNSADGTGKVTIPGKVQFTFHPKNGKDIVFDQGLTDVPVQRNWRTNITGKLLTGTIDFDITIDADFAGEYNGVPFEEVTDGVRYDGTTKTFYLSNSNGFEWFVSKSNTAGTKATESEEADVDTKGGTFDGMTVKLTQNIDLSNENFTPIGSVNTFKGIFDGGNNTISNLKVEGDTFGALFANVLGTIKNVKVSGVNVKGTHYVGGIVGYIYGNIENCHVEGGSITANVDSNKDNGDKAGGIVGYVGEGSYTIKDCSVKNLTIKAYRDVAGIAGCAQTGVQVQNNIVDNVTVIADQLVEYKESGKEANAGEVVGRNIANADLSTNTVNNVTVRVIANNNGQVTVGNAEELNTAIGTKGISTITLEEGVYEGHFDLTDKNLSIQAKDGKNVTIKGSVWVDNCKVTLKGLTITNPNGVQHPNPQNSTYYNTINSQYPCIGAYNYADVTMENCTFDLTGLTVYGFYGYAHNTPTFTNCTFNCNKIRPIANNGDAITVTGCTFNNQYHYSLRIFENSEKKQTVVFTNNTIQGSNDKNEFEGVNISKKGTTAVVLGSFTIKGNTTGLKYRYHKNVTMSVGCTYETDITGFAFEKEN